MLIAAPAQHTPGINLRDEHAASRKAWGRYINLSSVVHRQIVAQADEHIAQVRARLARALQRS